MKKRDRLHPTKFNEQIYAHFKHIVLRICIIPSVLSSHSPPLPFTMPPPRPVGTPIPPILEVPSSLSSIRSALVQTTMIGTPAALWVSVPGPRGRTAFDERAVEDVDGTTMEGSEDGSV